MNTRYLMTGDPTKPESDDLIAETTSLKVGRPVPEGWRVLSGNERFSTIARVVLRYEIVD